MGCNKTPLHEPGRGAGKVMLLICLAPQGRGERRRSERSCVRPRAQVARRYAHKRRLSSSGSNQAREGRLVDALAVRGDEGRDTLR